MDGRPDRAMRPFDSRPAAHPTTLDRDVLARELHVWWIPSTDLQDPAVRERVRGWLTPDEQARVKRFHRATDRALHLGGRGLVRCVLSRYAPVAPGTWIFRATGDGRPELDARFDHLGLRFNLSHTPGLIACVVSDGADAGIDVERMGSVEDPIALAAEWFSPQERAGLSPMAPADAERRFFEIWTLKESYLKARGIGLGRVQLDQVTVALEGDGGVRMTFEPPVEDEPGHWQLDLWLRTAEHRGAVAVRHGGRGARRVVVRRARLLG